MYLNMTNKGEKVQIRWQDFEPVGLQLQYNLQGQSVFKVLLVVTVCPTGPNSKKRLLSKLNSV